MIYLFLLVPSSPTSTYLIQKGITDCLIGNSLIEYFNGHKEENAAHYQVRINSLSNFTEKLAEQNDMELTHSSNDSSNNEQTLLTSPIANGDRKRSLFNVGSAQNIRASSSSLQKAPVYAKVIKSKCSID